VQFQALDAVVQTIKPLSLLRAPRGGEQSGGSGDPVRRVTGDALCVAAMIWRHDGGR
jgi:hypothetical protein